MKTVLYIVKPDKSSKFVAQGYSDVFEHLGWKVFVCNPSAKFATEKLIEDHEIDLILTSCKHGVQQLPVELINARGIKVSVEALPWNDNLLNIDGKYEISDSLDIDIIQRLKHCFVHTNIVETLWPDYMSHWISSGIQLKHLSYAGNIFTALSNDYRCAKFRIAFVGNLMHKQDLIDSWLVPIFNRIKVLNFSTKIHGDDIWNNLSIDNDGQLSDPKRLSHIYSRSFVCFNFHTKGQKEAQAYINERSFMLQLCGGIQLTDMPLASTYFGNNVFTAKTSTEFIQSMENIIVKHTKNFDFLKRSVEQAAMNHTYFNRLSLMFDGLSMKNELEDCSREGLMLATMHTWRVQEGLDCAKRGKSYESFVRQIV